MSELDLEIFKSFLIELDFLLEVASSVGDFVLHLTELDEDSLSQGLSHTEVDAVLVFTLAHVMSLLCNSLVSFCSTVGDRVHGEHCHVVLVSAFLGSLGNFLDGF